MGAREIAESGGSASGFDAYPGVAGVTLRFYGEVDVRPVGEGRTDIALSAGAVAALAAELVESLNMRAGLLELSEDLATVEPYLSDLERAVRELRTLVLRGLS